MSEALDFASENPDNGELAGHPNLHTPIQDKPDAIAALAMKAYDLAGKIPLTLDEQAALLADFPDEDFYPGAAGKAHLIYLGHHRLRCRLTAVLGLGQWAFIEQARWTENFEWSTDGGEVRSGRRVYVEGILVIRGAFAGKGIGDATYYPNNPAGSMRDAAESAHSGALVTACKNFGIGLQAWDKRWQEGWRQRQAEAARAARNDTRLAATPPKVPNAQAQAEAEHQAAYRARMNAARLRYDALVKKCENVDQFNDVMKDYLAEFPEVKTAIRPIINDAAKAFGFQYDKTTTKFFVPEPTT